MTYEDLADDAADNDNLDTSSDDDTGQDDGGQDDDGEGEGEGDEEDDGSGDDSLEEVEWGGSKHRLPATIREALGRHDAYVRQDAELVTSRQAFERDRAASLEADTALRADYAKAEALALTVKEFEAIDWNALNQADPAAAQGLFFDYQKARAAADQAKAELDGKVKAHGQARAEATANAMRECGQVLARSIPNWGAKTANEIVQFGMREFGITQAEVAEMADPRIWKMLHRAMGATVTDRKAKLKETATKQQAVKPAAKGGGGGRGGPPPALSDRSGTEAWMKARTRELARKGR